MKKLLFLVLGLAGLCTAASAQTGFGWGVKGGINFTGVSNLNTAKPKQASLSVHLPTTVLPITSLCLPTCSTPVKESVSVKKKILAVKKD